MMCVSSLKESTMGVQASEDFDFEYQKHLPAPGVSSPSKFKILREVLDGIPSPYHIFMPMWEQALCHHVNI